MKIIICIALLSFTSEVSLAQMESRKAIKSLLDEQVTAWNNANLEQFMEGYWHSDSLQFVGAEIVHGWQLTLERYKKSYPDGKAMGQLRFELLGFDFIGTDGCLVTGKYFLKREKDQPHGIFTLLLKKKGGRWVIVSDHTS